VTALQPIPGPEKPEKGGKFPEPDVGTPFSGFPPFSDPGMVQGAALTGVAAAPAVVRSYRRIPPPELPRAPRRKPPSTGNGAARVGLGVAPPAPTLPAVPPEWCRGVALLATVLPPDGIAPPRWRAFQATAAQLLRDPGAELHAAGWDALDLFGLHATAPATNPSGWGLAWLAGAHGEVLDVAPDAVGMRRHPDGARLAYRRAGRMARAGMVPAWQLIEVSP